MIKNHYLLWLEHFKGKWRRKTKTKHFEELWSVLNLFKIVLPNCPKGGKGLKAIWKYDTIAKG